ncbi:hypothetical protein HQ496_05420 [bacterium]|nr:hypothetical protein [bacterium]
MQLFIDRLNQQLTELDGFTNMTLIRQETISKWSVGQHIEHSLIAISGMILALRKEHPGTGSRAPNVYRDSVMEAKQFPRGAIEAPAISRPSESPDQKFLQRMLIKTSNRVGNPLEISQKATLIHPIMNVMYRDEAIEFMTIHTEHHLKIIRDILSDDGAL